MHSLFTFSQSDYPLASVCQQEPENNMFTVNGQQVLSLFAQLALPYAAYWHRDIRVVCVVFRTVQAVCKARLRNIQQLARMQHQKVGFGIYIVIVLLLFCDVF